jgi:hypothetical protein
MFDQVQHLPQQPRKRYFTAHTNWLIFVKRQDIQCLIEAMKLVRYLAKHHIWRKRYAEIAKSQVGRIGCWCETTKGGVSEGKGFVEVEPVMR